MKFSALIIVAGIAPSILSTGSPQLGALGKGSEAVINLSPVLTYRSGPFQRQAEPNRLAARNGNLWKGQSPVGGQTSLTNSTSFHLKPGVYKTEPYACIVVVPGRSIDDHIVVTSDTPDAKMPVIKPDLRFVPFALK
jgi:hypothetical protein